MLSTIGKSQTNDEKKILQGWVKVAKEHKSIELNEEEKTQIDIARWADEQSKRSNFTLGGSLQQLIL
jgi:hypothetical protein